VAESNLYTAEEFRRRAFERLSRAPEPHVGDHVFNPEAADLFLKMERRPAAVLIPVIHREPEATLLFTERTGDLRSHAGQISFPGGRIDPDDTGAEAAALREAGEEIGLSPEFIETVGRGPDYLTGSGYHVALVIAVVSPGFTLKLNPAEVADVFEVPLSFLMNPANHHWGSRMLNGAKRTFFEMPFDNRHIWGITAGIVRVLYERLYADDGDKGAVA
jgi:8-oxo-dGTP pyrophosphatase MutT (NUDIX family)